MKDSISFMPEGLFSLMPQVVYYISPEGWRVPSLWMRRISCRVRLSLVPVMGQRALNFISETQ